MSFDNEGHIFLPPADLLEMAASDAAHLINYYLTRGTPQAFQKYSNYCAFLNDVSSRIGVHPNNLFLRGSCHLGYSIAPKSKLWSIMDTKGKPSDLDLVIVDVDYFGRLDGELRSHDAQNETLYLQKDSRRYLERLKDRQFNLCRDENMPTVTCVHHKDTMKRVPVVNYCGTKRDLSAFIFRDWMSLRCRYEYDLKQLLAGIQQGNLTPPPEKKAGSSAKEVADGSPAASSSIEAAGPPLASIKNN